MSEPSRQEIWKMFNALSSTYDKVNRWMTFGLDLYWRKKIGDFLPKGKELTILDCATGTADQILSLMRHQRRRISEVVGIDLASEMIEIGKKKIAKTPFASSISLQVANILEIPFAEKSFDCVTLSFGIRNVTDVSICLKEIQRVLKPGGKVLILETSHPKGKLFRTFHLWYIQVMLPIIGELISKKKHAYEYLQKTTQTFPHGQAFCDLLQKTGFIEVKNHPLTGGVVSIYEATK